MLVRTEYCLSKYFFLAMCFVTLWGVSERASAQGVSGWCDANPSVCNVEKILCPGCNSNAVPPGGKPKPGTVPTLLVSSVLIQFDFNSATITSKTSLQHLSKIARIMNGQDNSFALLGHTDSKGKQAFNCGLSKRRAGAVRKFLRGKGVRLRLNVVALGEFFLRNKKDGRAAENRRVSILEMNDIPKAKINVMRDKCQDLLLDD